MINIDIDPARWLRSLREMVRALPAELWVSIKEFRPYSLIRWLEPDVNKTILASSGEHKIMEIRKHWAASIGAMIRVVLASLGMVAGTIWTNSWAYWLIFMVCLMINMQGLWAILAEFRDRFLITNQRICRISGILSKVRASMPILRILDITALEPLMGRFLGYGHFVFESAAQIQGLNEITYVGDIDHREEVLRLAIHGDEEHERFTVAEDDGT